MLLERGKSLEALGEFAHEAAAGEGRLVLLVGEAGSGKTTLIEALEAGTPSATWLWGRCEAAAAPAPLSPLFDIAAAVGGELASACTAGEPREVLFRTLLDSLSSSGGLSVMVVEDVHWADESTLDMLRFLSRRIRRLRVLMLVTLRDDEPGGDHRLRVALGELSRLAVTRRMALPPLSREAVAGVAADAGLDADELYRLTGGNPFFVNEVLASGSTDLPASVRDAVLARVAQLTRPARELLDTVTVLGNSATLGLLGALVGDGIPGLDECLESRLLMTDGSVVRFRHRIARRAVDSDMAGHRREALHRAALAAMTALGEADDARLAYHAAACGDRDAVLEHAPAAARRARELASHRVAATQLEWAVAFADGLARREQAELRESLARELMLVDRWDDAASQWEASQRLWQQLGDTLREGDAMRARSRCAFWLGRGDEATALAQAALELLEPLGPTGALDRAIADLASQRMACGDPSALPLSHRAQAAARAASDLGLLSDALNTEGFFLVHAGQPAGLGLLREALAVALRSGRDDAAGRAFANLHAALTKQYGLKEAEEVFEQGIEYSDDHDVATFASCLRAEHCLTLLEMGRWDDAESLATRLLDGGGASPLNRIKPMATIAAVRARQGRGDAEDVLAEAERLAAGSNDAAFTIVTVPCRLEMTWLRGRTPGEAGVRAALESVDGADPWTRGKVVGWLRRLGAAVPPGLDVAEPFAAAWSGDWSAAAQHWRDLGCPYQEALVLLDSGQDEAMRRSVRILDSLGAAGTAAVARSTLRRAGVRAIPRGPRPPTRTDSLGLTPREREVMGLLSSGATNRQIADRLFISEKTVDHHVSAILTKLGVRSRAEAVAMDRRAGRT